MLSLFAFATPGPLELAIILGIVLLLFGSTKLPGLAKSMGQSISEFRKGMHNAEKELEEKPASEEKA